MEHRAVGEVLDVFPVPNGILLEGFEAREGSTVEVADLEAVCRELDLDRPALLGEPFAFVDRLGRYIAPWPVARRLALRVAERYTDLVLARIAEEEQQAQDRVVHGYTIRWSRSEPEHYVPPERCVDDLRQMEPVFAAVRRWCGATAVGRFDELAGLRDEVVRLRGLVEKAAAEFGERGHVRIAKHLLNELNRVSPTGSRRRSRQPTTG